jgi:uncharacterized metal-binding protein YceD (DUF177 family)
VSAERILSHPVNVADPPAAPVEISASAAERAQLAAAYDVVEVKALTASVGVATGPLGGLVVDGHVKADIVQECVVTLVPVEQHIDETFTVHFVRGPAPEIKPGAEIVIEPDQPDPPEYLDGPTIDVAALAEEYFALAIDPYPRAPGAELPAGVSDDAAENSPFAALADLVKPKRSPH